MKIIILDGYSINPGDLSWEPLEELATVEVHPRTPADKVIETIGDADGIFLSKVKLTKEVIEACPNLKFVGVTATGYDNVDLDTAKSRGIAVFNVPAYSTESVAQHTFALIMAIANKIDKYNADIKGGQWYTSSDFTFLNYNIMSLYGKSLGIIGYGSIGKRVAEIAQALGMVVNIYSKEKELAIKSDILSLHCPATTENKGFINSSFISQMKDGAILINTARGALLNDEDVKNALVSGKLSAIGIDVLSTEPPSAPHPFIELPNCYATPHIAWSPIEARATVIRVCTQNLKSYIEGTSTNRIV